MKRVGAHVSASGGVSNAIANANSINAKAFALFVKNQRQWFTKPFSQEEEEKFKKELNISADYILPHGSYLINLGSPSDEAREKSVKALSNELKLCERLGIKYLNVHPGSHLREISEEACLDRIALSVEEAHNPNVMIVLENTAGQGSNVGYKLEHLAHVAKKSSVPIGVCIDSCHALSAGYDLRSYDKSKKFFEDFDRIVGVDLLKGLHLNDSKTEYNSRKDRHESLGQGYLGLEFFKYVMKEDMFDDKPLILETPNPDKWAEEIELLYSFV